jgi:hypothetical protein
MGKDVVGLGDNAYDLCFLCWKIDESSDNQNLHSFVCL